MAAWGMNETATNELCETILFNIFQWHTESSRILKTDLILYVKGERVDQTLIGLQVFKCRIIFSAALF